ncbi:type VI secretion system (T6SS) effector Tae4 (amidase) [Litoreibacter halocynthiae]|uniref:Type VI secretion system (T6SS) effector Tae4 (Amidase) n=1 Tax=Litoreibacter halocynthiae TaxID=1242689 RepID=A0A4R7LCV0_9RHOB|nr:type VI secretion system (T6SS) effector Tae4 (amidase) [Litoreibacter halocynthiae]
MDEPIQEGSASNGSSGYVTFPDLKILPDFDKLWSGYPNQGSLDVVTQIGGEVQQLFGPTLEELLDGDDEPLPNEFSNTCVVRTSEAFNSVGPDYVPFVGFRDLETENGNEGRGFGITRGDLAISIYRPGGGANWPNGRPFAYGVRLDEFAPYMQYYFPDAPLIRGTNLQTPFVGKKGVVFFTVGGWDDANGHFDIWNGFAADDLVPNGQAEVGSRIRYLAYFRRSTTITLWQHVKIELKEIQRNDGVCTAVYQMQGS